MKKLFTLLAMCLLTLAGALQTHADYWQLSGLEETDYPAVESIEAGKWYVLSLPRESNDLHSYLSAGTTRMVAPDIIPDDCLWQFVPYRTDDQGNTTYVLKSKIKNAYLITGFNYTEDADRAWKFTALRAEGENIVDNSGYDAEDESTHIDWTQYDARNSTMNMNNSLEGLLLDDLYDLVFVLCQSPVNQETPNFLQSSGSFGGDRSINCWAIYEVIPAEPLDVLENYMANHSFDPNAFEVGDEPGMYDGDKLEAATEAWDALDALLIDTDLTLEKVSKAIEAFEKAYKELNESIVVFGYGYYVFQNANQNGAMYGSEDLETLWTPNYTMPENDEDWTMQDIRHIWEFVNIDGKDYLRHYATGNYLARPTKIYERCPLTKEPTYNYSVEANADNEGGLTGWFNIIDTGIEMGESSWQTGYPGWDAGTARCVHTQNNGFSTVYWNEKKQNSLWRVHAVPASIIELWLGRIDQEERNEALAALYDKAWATYTKAESECYDSDATQDGDFADPADGLVTSIEQFRTNTGDGSEGPANGLFDGDFTSYFHSDWHGNATDSHNFQIDLGKEVDIVTLKIASRNHQNRAEPVKMQVLGSNTLPTLFESDYDQGCREEDLTEWEECGTIDMNYKYNYGDGGDQRVVGLGVARLSAPYRYLRFNVKTRRNNSVAYFTMSELRAYETTSDWSRGNLSSMDPTVLKNFQDALAEAKAAIADRNATDELIAKLQAAYDAFLEGYPEPQVLVDLKAEAMTWIENSIIGEEPGMYPSSALDELEEAINSVEVESVMSLEAVNTGKKVINDALAAFKAQLVLPTSGNYMIRSISTGVPGHNLMCALTPGHGILGWGGYNSETEEDETSIRDFERLNYLWQLVDNGDHTFSLRNYDTNTYLALADKSGMRVKMTPDAEEAFHFTLQSCRSAEQPGFNLVFAENVFLNFQPGGQSIVTWNAAQGLDNSAFVFEAFDEASWNENHLTTYSCSASEPHIITLPYEVSLAQSYRPLYKMIGMDANGDYQFKKFQQSEIVPAGTPMLSFIPAGSSATQDNFVVNTTGLKDMQYMAYTQENLFHNQNGMVGVLDDVEIPANCGIFYDFQNVGGITASEEGEVVAAGSGYFVKDEQTTEKGDLTIKGSSHITVDFKESTGVSTLVVIDNHKTRGTFNLMGQKVNGKLPAGLYIIDGQKYLVK